MRRGEERERERERNVKKFTISVLLEVYIY